MVFFYISKYVTKSIGPPLFRNGLRLRNWLAPIAAGSSSDVTKPSSSNNYWLDMACMIPYSQKLLSLAVYDESKRKTGQFRKEYHAREQEKSNDDSTFSSSPSRDQEAIMAMAMMTDSKAIRSLSDIRVKVLEEYLRASLIPNNIWSDVEDGWRYNNRIVAWARKEFLIGKYGPYIQEALVAYPELRNSPQLSPIGGSGRGGNKRQLLLDLVHRGEINTDNITGESSRNSNNVSPFLQLPRSDVILDAFHMKEWSTNKDISKVTESLAPIARQFGGKILRQEFSMENQKTSIQHIEVPSKTNVGAVDLDDLLEVVTRGYVKNCGPLNALCQEANFYQLYSKEYIQCLGDYLLKRTMATRRSTVGESRNTGVANDQTFLEEKPSMSPDTVVIDIGAGDGLLMHCLRDYMERKVMGMPLSNYKGASQRKKDRRKKRNSKELEEPMVIPTMVATDDMSWRIFAKAKVEKLTVEQALEKYTTRLDDDIAKSGSSPKNPPQVIVLCSWMPMGQDWTSLFRRAQVEEYILIGEADDGSCGDNWLTWGNPEFYDADNLGGDRTPPHEAEGYSRKDMNALTKYQFSSFDLANTKSSKTVSFRRLKEI